MGGQVTDLAVDPRDAQHVLVGGDLTGIAVSTDGTRSWQPGTGLPSQEIASFSFGAALGEVWAGTMSGPVHSLDGGHTWVSARAGMPPFSGGSYSVPIQEVLIDPSNAAHLTALSGSHRGWSSAGSPDWGSVWESRDDGTSWQRIGQLPPVGSDPRNVVAIVRVPGGLLAAVEHHGIFSSTDGGRTWSAYGTGLPSGEVRDVLVLPGSPETLLAALDGSGGNTPGDVYRSEDGGATWVASDTGLSRHVDADAGVRSHYEALAASAASPGVVWTSDAGYYTAGVFRSGDGGRTWQRVLDTAARVPGKAYDTGLSGEVLAADPSDGRRLLVGTAESVLQTTDGGASFADAAADDLPGGRSRGRGAVGLVTTRVLLDPAHPGRIVATALDGGALLLSQDGGVSWARPLRTHDHFGGAYDAALDGDTLAVLLGQQGIFGGVAVSHDGGVSFTFADGAPAGLPARGSRSSPEPGGVAVLPGGSVLVATVGGTAYRSIDGGAHWSAGPSGGWGALAVGTGHMLSALASDGVHQSSDGGLSWQLLPGSPAAAPGAGRLSAAALPAGDLLVTQWRTGQGGLWRLAGRSWVLLRPDRYSYDAAGDPADPAHLVAVDLDHPFHDVVAAGGLWESVDGGRTWRQRNEGLPMLRIATVAFDPAVRGRVVVGTFGAGFWRRQL